MQKKKRKKRKRKSNREIHGALDLHNIAKTKPIIIKKEKNSFRYVTKNIG